MNKSCEFIIIVCLITLFLLFSINLLIIEHYIKEVEQMQKEFRDMRKDELNEVVSQIQFNISEEAKAGQFYFELKNKIAKEDEKIIDEIIGDELDHAIKLGKLQEKYSLVFPNEYEPLLNLERK